MNRFVKSPEGQVTRGVALKVLGLRIATSAAGPIGAIVGIALSFKGTIQMATGIAKMADDGSDAQKIQKAQETMETLVNPAGLPTFAATLGNLEAARTASTVYDVTTLSVHVSQILTGTATKSEVVLVILDGAEYTEANENRGSED